MYLIAWMLATLAPFQAHCFLGFVAYCCHPVPCVDDVRLFDEVNWPFPHCIHWAQYCICATCELNMYCRDCFAGALQFAPVLSNSGRMDWEIGPRHAMDTHLSVSIFQRCDSLLCQLCCRWSRLSVFRVPVPLPVWVLSVVCAVTWSLLGWWPKKELGHRR